MTDLDSTAARAPDPRTRIVFVEGRAILREGLRALIDDEPDFEVAGDFGAAAEGLAGIRRLQPDVVLIDFILPETSGCELLAQIKHAAPRARTLVLTAHDGEGNIRAALNAGAQGYVLTHANRAELLPAIRSVSAGRHFISRGIANKILSGYLSGKKRRRKRKLPRGLTARERQVLRRVALGNSNKVIALELSLSVKTVEKHRSNLMRKLNLHNAAAVTLFAVRAGLAEEPPPGRLEGGPEHALSAD
ncbi:MAG: LuxR C-terminal-related transcriptional regulator [Steroidobacteraceae bacterium]